MALIAKLLSLTSIEKALLLALMAIMPPAGYTIYNRPPQTVFPSDGDIDNDGVLDEQDEVVNLNSLDEDFEDKVGVCMDLLPPGTVIGDAQYITLGDKRFVVIDFSSQDGISQFSRIKRELRRIEAVTSSKTATGSNLPNHP